MKGIFKFLIVSIFIITTSFVPKENKYEKELDKIESNLDKAQKNLEAISKDTINETR